MKNQQPSMEVEEESNQSESSSSYSSEDQNAYLLTDAVQEKILDTVARLKNKDPSIYQVKESIFKENDFDNEEEQAPKPKDKKSKKLTYKQLLTQKGNFEESDKESDEQLAPVQEEKRAKNKFKKALQNQLADEETDQNDLFVIKNKQKKVKADPQNNQQTVARSQKLVQKVWSDQSKMDETDLFLKNYIVGKKWLAGKANSGFEQIDKEDQERSQEMDEYEAKYNFRFQEPDGNKIVQYPRKIKDSMRNKTESRKEKRKKLEQRKKEQEKKIFEEAMEKRKQLKKNILDKVQQNQDEDVEEGFEKDWFFCDDCGNGFEEGEVSFQCQECDDYMLCSECNDLIIHKHALTKAKIPKGHGAPRPEVRAKILSELQPCKNCRRQIPLFASHYEYKDRALNLHLLCEKCFDQSPLQFKKKYEKVESKHTNYEEMFDKDPEKVKELTNSKQIQEMVDEYLQNQFEGVLGDGIRTKFKYVKVKPQSYGLSDEQILYGDDRQLNSYVSVKKMAPYIEDNIKLRNNQFKKKSKNIDKTVKENKKLVQSGNEVKVRKIRAIDKMKQRAALLKNKREKKLRILNISNPQREKKAFVSNSRLASYGVAGTETKE